MFGRFSCGTLSVVPPRVRERVEDLFPSETGLGDSPWPFTSVWKEYEGRGSP